MRIDRTFFALAIAAALLPSAAAFIPSIVEGQVVISEIMYDVASGVGADDTREWIEVFNAGASSVSIVGWKINDGSNHVLSEPPANGGLGSLTIQSGAYAILADDAATFRALYPSVTTVIDTLLDLSNTTDTITLINADGAVVDTVAYTKDQGAAGDGNSLQRSSAAGTALFATGPTPGTGALTSQEGTAATTSPTTSTTSQPPAPVSSYVPPPLPQLFAEAGDDREVIVAADTEFTGFAYNREGTVIETNVRYLWNFGDGSTAEGASVLHHYAYPGRYVVVLSIAENKESAADRFVVSAQPAHISFSALPDGGVSIENDSGKDLDLSYWIIRSFGQSFTLPESTVVLAGETLRIPQKTLKFWSGSSALLQYPNGTTALAAGQQSGEAIVPPASSMHAEAPATAPKLPAEPAWLTVGESSARDETTIPEVDEAPNPPEIVAGAPPETAAVSAASSMPWWLGAFAIATFGAGAAFLARRSAKREWNIIEEGSETV
ncbi:MAG: lamin tail domain-containing protein [Candidatus Kaiserbacteria bacterium]|nr:MAG: lamin tail domain-containing protein [Candidatus Kaiserbacteria bacterium]